MNRFMKGILALTLTAGTVLPLSEQAFAATYSSVVDYVVDGDTVYLKNAANGTTKVRLLSVDAPETNYNGYSQGTYGEAAKQYLINLLPPGTPITLETDVDELDTYGRLLAHVFKGSLDVNKDLLSKGHAVTYYIYPNTKYFTDYRSAMVSARNAGLGLWNPASPLTEMPFEFRLRMGNRTPDKFVGNYNTKKYVQPADYKNVAIEDRMFFFTEQDAISAGYTANGTPGVKTGLYINEVLPAPSTKFTSEFIEIYNANNTAVDLSGYKIDDLLNAGSAPYTIPAGTTIPAKGHFVWTTNSYFNNTGDDANLIAPDGTVIDSFTYGSSKSDASWYRYPDGGAWSTTMDTTPTQGTTNN